MSIILLYSISLFIFWFLFNVFGKRFAIDHPDKRKKHINATPQSGGIIFGLMIIFPLFFIVDIPNWFIIGCIVSLGLGVLDDFLSINWKLKLLIQIFLGIYLVQFFWGQLDYILFYNYKLYLDDMTLFFLFMIWFIGIYNSVNLIDGIDGLAGGLNIIYCFIFLQLFSNTDISIIFIIFALPLLIFMIFNQRPAKIFMGDGGSLFLGFFIASTPLLLFDSSNQIISNIDMTPFILITSYLIADTTRVFLTRIINGKSPMAPDTIHLHHLLLQKSGSYLIAIFIIYFLNIFTASMAIINLNYNFSSEILILHISLLFIFILTPPATTYVKFARKLAKPLYAWQKALDKKSTPFYLRTFLVLSLAGSIYLILFLNSYQYIGYEFLLGFFTCIVIIILNHKHYYNISIIQILGILIIWELSYNMQFSLVLKLLSILLFISWIVFTLQLKVGTIIRDYSSLDILVLLLCITIILLSYLELLNFNYWTFFLMGAFWLNSGFILRRTLYLSK